MEEFGFDFLKGVFIMMNFTDKFMLKNGYRNHKGNRFWKHVGVVVNDSPYGERCLTLWQMYKLLLENGESDMADVCHRMALRYGWSRKATFGRPKRRRVTETARRCREIWRKYKRNTE